MTRPRQRLLFPECARPRRSPRVLMHVIDAGDDEGGLIAQFECKRCGFASDWLHVDTVTEAKRGLPCPRCNVSPEKDPT